ncbi:HSP20-like chaperone [Dipodascopsis uninucleata]
MPAIIDPFDIFNPFPTAELLFGNRPGYSSSPVKLNEAGSGSCGRWGAHSKSAATSEDVNFRPAIDIFDDERSYTVHASLPGAAPGSVNVDFDPQSNELIISGTLSRPGVYASDDAIKRLRLGERRVGKYERRIRISPGTKLDADNVSAKLANGLLEVSIPKAEQQTKRRVTVETVPSTDDWIDAAQVEDSSVESAASAGEQPTDLSEKLD